MRRTIAARVRSESPPNAARFALDFARLAGGDVVWLAYVPDGLRSWFRRFADSCDPGPLADAFAEVGRQIDAIPTPPNWPKSPET
jgi:hypothetical protein